MKRMSFGYLVMFFLLLAPLPVRAEITVTVANGSSLEISYLYMDSGKSGMGSSMNLVPGNKINMNDGDASALRELKIYAGTKCYTFESLNLQGPKQLVRFELAEDGTPLLVTGNKSRSDAQKESFDAEAGPINSNDHAKKRCPEVLAAWLEANPGCEAEWTGNWATTVPGEMSVCNIRIKKAPSKTEHSTGTIRGKASPMVPDGTEAVEFSRVTSAGTIAALRTANITEAPHPFQNEFFLPVTFAQKTWLARISPENSGEYFARSADACPVRSVTLRAVTSENDLKNTLLALSSAGYRPWFAYVKEGEKMDIRDAESFWDKSEATQSDAEETMAETSAAIYNMSEPASLDALYIPAQNWDEAVAGANPAVPVFRLHITSGKNISLIWMANGSMLIESCRE